MVRVKQQQHIEKRSSRNGPNLDLPVVDASGPDAVAMGLVTAPPGVITDDEDASNAREEIFKVDQILDRRTGTSGRMEYRLSWVGFPATHNSWEPEENLNCQDLIRSFNRKQDARERRRDNDFTPSSPSAKKKPRSSTTSRGTDDSDQGDGDDDEEVQMPRESKKITKAKKSLNATKATTSSKEVTPIRQTSGRPTRSSRSATRVRYDIEDPEEDEDFSPDQDYQSSGKVTRNSKKSKIKANKQASEQECNTTVVKASPPPSTKNPQRRVSFENVVENKDPQASSSCDHPCELVVNLKSNGGIDLETLVEVATEPEKAMDNDDTDVDSPLTDSPLEAEVVPEEEAKAVPELEAKAVHEQESTKPELVPPKVPEPDLIPLGKRLLVHGGGPRRLNQLPAKPPSVVSKVSPQPSASAPAMRKTPLPVHVSRSRPFSKSLRLTSPPKKIEQSPFPSRVSTKPRMTTSTSSASASSPSGHSAAVGVSTPVALSDKALPASDHLQEEEQNLDAILSLTSPEDFDIIGIGIHAAHGLVAALKIRATGREVALKTSELAKYPDLASSLAFYYSSHIPIARVGAVLPLDRG